MLLTVQKAVGPNKRIKPAGWVAVGVMIIKGTHLHVRVFYGIDSTLSRRAVPPHQARKSSGHAGVPVSAARRVLPIPASPETSASLSSPFAATFRCSSIESIWFWRPQKGRPSLSDQTGWSRHVITNAPKCRVSPRRLRQPELRACRPWTVKEGILETPSRPHDPQHLDDRLVIDRRASLSWRFRRCPLGRRSSRHRAKRPTGLITMPARQGAQLIEYHHLLGLEPAGSKSHLLGHTFVRPRPPPAHPPTPKTWVLELARKRTFSNEASTPLLTFRRANSAIDIS